MQAVTPTHSILLNFHYRSFDNIISLNAQKNFNRNVKMIEYRFCNMQATCNGKSAKKDSVICKPHAMNKTAKTGFCKV